MTQDCIFCKIINGQLPVQPLLENDDVVVLKDIAPKAPIHYLIIPKKHVENIQGFSHEDTVLMGKLLGAATSVAQKLNAPDFKLVINNGYAAGQRVFHLHIHFLAGRLMGEV